MSQSASKELQDVKFCPDVRGSSLDISAVLGIKIISAVFGTPRIFTELYKYLFNKTERVHDKTE